MNTFTTDRRSFLSSMAFASMGLLLPCSASLAKVHKIRLVRRVHKNLLYRLRSGYDLHVTQWRNVGETEWHDWQTTGGWTVIPDNIDEFVELGYYTFDLEKFSDTIRRLDYAHRSAILHIVTIGGMEIESKMTVAKARSLFAANYNEILVTSISDRFP